MYAEEILVLGSYSVCVMCVFCCKEAMVDGE